MSSSGKAPRYIVGMMAFKVRWISGGALQMSSAYLHIYLYATAPRLWALFDE